MKNTKGEITVFLTLILTLILALVGTMIEITRVNIAKVFAERALITAMDSSFAAFHEPISSDYHLMLLDMGYQTGELNEQKAIDELIYFMEFTFSPNKDLESLILNSTISNLDLYKITTKDLTMGNKAFITDYEGELFMNQVMGYMKYRINGNLIEGILKKISLLDKNKVAAEILSKKLIVEEELVELDQCTMELMEIVEGIKFNKKGIEVKSNGLIKTEEIFVKKLSVQGNGMNNVGINQEVVYESLKNEYVNPNIYIDQIINSAITIQEGEVRKSELNYEYIKLDEEIRKLLVQETEMKGGKEIVKEDSIVKEGELESKKSSIEEKKDKIIKQVESIDKKKKEFLQNIKLLQQEFEELIAKVLPKNKEAISIIEKYNEKQKVLSSQVGQLKTFLDNRKGEIEDDFYNSIQSDIIRMRGSINNVGGDTESGSTKINIDYLKTCLEANNKLLTNIESLNTIDLSEDATELINLQAVCSRIKSQINNYYIKELRFDYGNLKIEPNIENPIEYFSELIKNDVMELIVDDVNKLSKSQLSETELPSQAKKHKNDQEMINNLQRDESLKNALSDANESGYSSEITNSFSSFTSQGEPVSTKDGIGKDFMELILLHEYIANHFNQYLKEEDKKINNKETALEYEQEYIIIGNEKDRNNLEGVVLRMLTIRTISNFIYLLSDRQRSDEAFITATALVGITGLAPLIHLTKALILMVWAYEEALIDTSGILKGKSVPLIKNKTNFILNYNELLCVNKAFIKGKVELLKEENGGINEFEYKDYIKMFLMSMDKKVKLYRCMDLIQENMNNRYKDKLRLKNCAFGFSVNAKFNIEAKFIKLPLIQKTVKFNDENFEYNIERAYSY